MQASATRALFVSETYEGIASAEAKMALTNAVTAEMRCARFFFWSSGFSSRVGSSWRRGV